MAKFSFNSLIDSISKLISEEEVVERPHRDPQQAAHEIEIQNAILVTTYDSRVSITQFLFGVAGADDFVNAKELRCLSRIATYLGVSDKDFKEIKQAFLQTSSPYAVLGVDEEATIEQVKIAYRKMVLKFHPDKREAHITEEEANIKFREIQRAFELIKEKLG